MVLAGVRAGNPLRAIYAEVDHLLLKQGYDNRPDHPATPGLWAVEPHFGLRGTGVKFEEILVVTENDAHWLDDDLPHVRRFARSSA
jgi:hypothetical protein